jgi:hypothetical protein
VKTQAVQVAVNEHDYDNDHLHVNVNDEVGSAGDERKPGTNFGSGALVPWIRDFDQKSWRRTTVIFVFGRAVPAIATVDHPSPTSATNFCARGLDLRFRSPFRSGLTVRNSRAGPA